MSLAATLALGAGCANAFGDTTYFYTGTNFTIVTPPYTTSDLVTGSITLPTPLASDLFFAAIMPPAFSFSDGVQTLSDANTNHNTFIVSTNAVGDITNWFMSVSAEVGGVDLETIVTANSPGLVFDLGACPDSVRR